MSKKYETVCSDPGMDKRWQAESDLRLLKDAAEVMKDKARLKAAIEMAKKQKVALEELLEHREMDKDED